MILCGFFGAVAAPAYAQVQEAPDPQVDKSPETVLALLDYNRNLCDRVAGKVVARWQSLGDSAEAVEAVRQYVVDEEMSELAAGSAAAGIIRRFMKQVRSESSPATVGSLERIAELIQDLCDSVAWPSPPQESFGAKLRSTLDGIEQERLDLGGRLLVSDEQLRELLAPYLSPIQLAGVEAHDEYLDYLESIKPKPRGPGLLDLVQAWHRRYAEATRPTKIALAHFIEARNRQDARAIVETCKEIIAAVIPLLRDDEVFKIPTQQQPASKGVRPELIPSLQQAYREIRDVAVNCTAGRQREVLEHFGEMQKQLQTAAAFLGRYSLAP
ncbi:MAG: hypothetical protein V3T72_03010 [Thermoanaerobaculia bacterium]